MTKEKIFFLKALYQISILNVFTKFSSLFNNQELYLHIVTFIYYLLGMKRNIFKILIIFYYNSYNKIHDITLDEDISRYT